MLVRQCTLTSGTSITKAWIDAYRARVGKPVRLLDSEDPERIWLVAVAGEYVEDSAHLKHTWSNNI